MNAILKIDKPSGPTSHDVVNRMRKLTSVKRVGHAGTLDPFATGLLLVGVGNATRILEYLTHMEKTYQTVARLGVTTDTFDREGKIVDEKTVDIDEKKVRETLLSFVGEYDQIPPMYSSKKHNGIRLYKLAREGKIITMPPKRVLIRSIDVNKIELPYIHFTAKVSEGTYIRSLCRDIGLKLGCGAIAQELRRTEIGPFDLSGSCDPYQMDSVEHLNFMTDEEATSGLFPTVRIKDSGVEKLEHGQPLTIEDIESFDDFEKNDLVRALDKNGRLVSIAKTERKANFLNTLKDHERGDVIVRPKKVFTR